MIHFEFNATDGIAIIRPSGSLRKEDFVKVASKIDPYIEQHGKINGLVICAKAFPGWHDFGALISHLKFVRNHHRHIKKVAAVTGSAFLTIMSQVVGHFVKADVRHFDFDKFDDAMAWVRAAESSTKSKPQSLPPRP